MKTKIFLFIILSFSLSLAKSQEVSAYVRIEDKSLEPTVSTSLTKQGEQVLRVISKNEVFNSILLNAKIKKFEKAFPTVKNEWLKKVYIVVSDNEKLFNDLKQDRFKGSISHVEILSEPQPCYTPNDYGLAIKQTNLDLVKAKGAWDIIGNIPRLPIGIVDDRVDTSHPDLRGQFIGAVHVVEDPKTDSIVHGTSVAGVISAATDNFKGISSIGFGAKMYTTDGGSRTVHHLAEMGYRIINCSWVYGCNYSEIDDSLYREIRDDLNTVVVFGAGNSHVGCAGKFSKVYPSSYPSVLSVTSVGHINPIRNIGQSDCIDCHERVLGDSNTTYHHYDEIDICAPGYSVPTTMCCGFPTYGNGWGTSYAAPHVTAAIGLVLSINPCLTAKQVMNIIKITADSSIYTLPCNQPYLGRLGTGRLDIEKACMFAARSATKIFEIPTVFINDTIIESNYAIKNTAPVTIESGADVQFKARREIELGAGFEVKSGATFSAEIDPNLKICQ